MDCLHHKTFPYATTRSLQALSDACIKHALDSAKLWSETNLSTVQFGPCNLQKYLGGLWFELFGRGIEISLSLFDQAWFKRLSTKHRQEDLLCDCIPQTNMMFIESVILLYRLDPGKGRLDRSPDSIIDAVDWTGQGARREAGLRVLKGKWWEVLNNA